MENWLLLAVGIVFLVCMIAGFVKGFLRIGLSLLSTILTLVLVSFLSPPYVSDALMKHTPAQDVLEKKIVEAFMPELSADDLLKANLSGTPLENLTVDQIKSLSESGWDKLGGITAQDILKVVGDLPKDTQIREIENSMLPQFLKDALLENNNTAIYEELDVTTFPEYVAAYISRMLLNVVSFLVTFLIAIILVSALMYAVNIIGELPLLGAINHLAGGVLGIGLGCIIVWIAFLVLTLIYTTEIGTTCYAMVEQSAILTFLYKHNPLLIWLLGFR